MIQACSNLHCKSDRRSPKTYFAKILAAIRSRPKSIKKLKNQIERAQHVGPPMAPNLKMASEKMVTFGDQFKVGLDGRNPYQEVLPDP